MANSPDLSQFKDLRIYDRDGQDIFNVALQDLKMKLPEWQPREDSTEVVLMESLALEVSEAIFAINRLPGSIMTILMQMYGITRDEGAYPQSTVQFTLVDTFGHSIPKGTRLLLELPAGREPIVFTTDSEAVAPSGSNTASATITGSRFTTEANGIVSGTELEMLDSIIYVERAVLSTQVTDGRGPETDTEWSARGAQRLRRLSDVLVVPDHFVSAAMEDPDITRAFAIDLYDPAVPGSSSPGHLSLAVYGEDRLLTAGEKEALRLALDGQAAANLAVHVIDPTITTLNVTVTVHKFASYTDQEVRDGISAALTEYLNADTWPWAAVVRVNELIALVSNVASVDYVSAVNSPAANVDLTGVAPLVNLGTLTVNFV